MSNPPLSQIEEIARVIAAEDDPSLWNWPEPDGRKEMREHYCDIARAILPFITAARAEGAKDMREQAARMTRELAIEMRDHRCDGSAFVDAAARKIAALPITQENEQ